MALKDNNSTVRMIAAQDLGKLGDIRAVEPLILALKDDNSWVRFSAAEALGNVYQNINDSDINADDNDAQNNKTKAVKQLIQSLSDGDNNVPYIAAKSRGIIGDRRAIEPLASALKDSD
jgi:HEAT repeat protein